MGDGSDSVGNDLDNDNFLRGGGLGDVANAATSPVNDLTMGGCVECLKVTALPLFPLCLSLW